MCYGVPAVGAIVTSVLWNKTRNTRLGWLNLLFWGGALFGVIDHLWNKELFLISKNLASDLMLGAVITAVIFASWLFLVLADKKKPVAAECAKA
ncbi:MAG: hypothetical protein FJZ13_03815 [Candidatus Omnitrophica bacterium]|nr:hypothetical protein [Candidatus Omnitrophota bacterium]